MGVKQWGSGAMPYLTPIFRAVLLALPLAASANGSFSVDGEFAPVKKQIPALWASLGKAFELPADGWAIRVGDTVNPNLGGKRIGPWCFSTRPKGTKPPDTLVLCVNTEARWLDAKGKPVDMEKAVRVEERFEAVEIKPLAR